MNARNIEQTSRKRRAIIEQTLSKRRADVEQLAHIFRIHLLDVCSMFAQSCKLGRPITFITIHTCSCARLRPRSCAGR